MHEHRGHSSLSDVSVDPVKEEGCLSLRYIKCFVWPTDEYEVYIKEQEATFKPEVTDTAVGDIPPNVVTTMKQMTTTVISGQVRDHYPGTHFV